MTRITLDVEFYIHICCHEKCDITWAVPTSFNKNRRKDHEFFYCPNGHPQYYTHPSEEERLKSQLKYCRRQKDNWRDKAERIERSRSSYIGQITKMKNAMRQDGAAVGS